MGVGRVVTPWNYVGHSKFWPIKFHIFHWKLLLDSSASFTPWRLKDLRQKWKVKLIFRGASLMAWADWPGLPPPYFTTDRRHWSPPRRLCFHRRYSLFVWQKDYAETSQPILTKFGGKEPHGPRKNPLYFGGNADNVTLGLVLG